MLYLNNLRETMSRVFLLYVTFKLLHVSKAPALLKSMLEYIARLSFRFPVEIMHVITRVTMP